MYIWAGSSGYGQEEETLEILGALTTTASSEAKFGLYGGKGETEIKRGSVR